MAIPKRGSRNIVVNGDPYRWYVRRKPSHAQADFFTGMGLAVERADVKGAVLVVELPQPHPGIWSGYPAERPVVPVDVEAYIQTALARGWQPGKPGKTFALDMTEND